jgi:hypothetical protein
VTNPLGSLIEGLALVKVELRSVTGYRGVDSHSRPAGEHP